MNTAFHSLVRVEGDLSICRLAELRDRFLAEMAADHDVDLDLTGVTSVDSLAIQLVVAAVRTAARSGRCWRTVAASEPVLSRATLLGVAAADLGLSVPHP